MAAGELSSVQRTDLDRAIRAAEQTSRFEFSVFLGAPDGTPRPFAQRLHATLVAPTRSILIMVDLEGRAVEVVTGAEVRRTLTDGSVALAVASMQAAFAAGDVVGGLKSGLAQLAGNARAPMTLHAGE